MDNGGVNAREWLLTSSSHRRESCIIPVSHYADNMARAFVARDVRVLYAFPIAPGFRHLQAVLAFAVYGLKEIGDPPEGVIIGYCATDAGEK